MEVPERNRDRRSSPARSLQRMVVAQSMRMSNMLQDVFGSRSVDDLFLQTSRSGTPNKRDSIKDELPTAGKDSGGPSQPLVKIGHYILGAYWVFSSRELDHAELSSVKQITSPIFEEFFFYFLIDLFFLYFFKAENIIF
jgi:hypothetical protein